jgi:glycosyltransferase involved in cell wall biosynthesis
MSPDITILMPVRNGMPHLHSAVESILSQTFSSFFLFVIDDGSTDGSRELVQNFSTLDSRVKLLHNPGRGISDALNFGVQMSSSRYIARMDADDIATPERLMLQISRLRSTPDLLLVGSNIEYFGDKTGRSYLPLSRRAHIYGLLFGPTCAHPTFLIDRQRLLNSDDFLYESNDNVAQDYALLTKLAMKGYNLGNCREILLFYRIHTQQTSKNRTKQALSATNTATVYKNFQKYNIPDDIIYFFHNYDHMKFDFKFTFIVISYLLSHIIRGLYDRKYHSLTATIKIVSILRKFIWNINMGARN